MTYNIPNTNASFIATKDRKTELQYFHRKRRSPTEPSLFAEGNEIRPNESTRWLGVFFDRSLRFRHHIKKACERSVAITSHLKRLQSTTRGISPLLLRQALQGVALPTLLYGAETWFSKGTSKSTIAKIQLRMNDAARAAFPVYRTTPVPALLREVGWGPALAWLERLHDRLAVRVASADPQHPLRKRWNTTHMNWVRQRVSPELSTDTIIPPWMPSREATLKSIGAVGRTIGKLEFKRWQATCSPLDLFVFSDGALIENRSGAGYAIYRGLTQQIHQGSLPLGTSAEVYDAEIRGATDGLAAALHSPMARFALTTKRLLSGSNLTLLHQAARNL